VAASILQEPAAVENTGGSTTITKAFASNVTAGSAIHAIGVCYGTGVTFTFSDGHNTYTSNLDNINDGLNQMAQGYALNCTGVATTVTLTISSSLGLGLLIREVGGCATGSIDNHGGAYTTASLTPSINLSLTAAGALISAVCGELNFGTAVSAGSGYTAGQSNVWLDNNSTKTGTSESEHFSTSGSKSVAFSMGASQQTLLVAMSFADAAAGSTYQPYFRWPRVIGAPDPEIDPIQPDHAKLHRYRTGYQTVGQSWWKLWPRFVGAPDPEIQPPPPDNQTLFKFRAITITSGPGQPFFLWPRFVGSADPEIDPVQPDHTRLHRYRTGYQTVGQPWQLLWPRVIGAPDPEIQPPPPVHVALHLYRTGYQTVR